MVFNGRCRYAEVLYFFLVCKGDTQHTLAAVQMFALPDPQLLKESYGTLHVCRFPGEEGLVVVDVKGLTDVVGMVPFHRPVQGGGDPSQGEYFPIEKISLTSTQIIEDNNDNDT
jgi:hypothetical protein